MKQEYHILEPQHTLKKVGYTSTESTVLSNISDKDIISTIERAYKEAVRTMNDLGISFSKEEIKDIITKPVKVAQIDEIDDHDEEDYENVSLVDNTQCTGKLQLENEGFRTDIAAME